MNEKRATEIIERGWIDEYKIICPHWAILHGKFNWEDLMAIAWWMANKHKPSECEEDQ